MPILTIPATTEPHPFLSRPHGADFLQQLPGAIRDAALLLFLTAVGFLAMGYHPCAEDDALYVTAVKSDLNPVLYPHDADFFKLQLKTTTFDFWMADFVRATGITVAWSELIWQIVCLFGIVVACWLIINQLFEDSAARWGSIVLLTAMFTLPVAGTALYIADQYLHPRAAATALILFAVTRIMARKEWQAGPLLLLSFALHPLMGAFGISLCCAMTLTFTDGLYKGVRLLRGWLFEDPMMAVSVMALIPFGWLVDPPTPIWLTAIRSRHWFRLYEWTWYEWLGAIMPLLIFWAVSRIARKNSNVMLARFCDGILIYSIFHQALAMLILGPSQLITLSALEPMRYLHLVYVFMVIIIGAYAGKNLLKSSIWRWAVILLAANASMFCVQRALFAGSEHIELYETSSTNPWMQSFLWIRANTPINAYFAIDPNYMALPGENYHGFRAVAERSVLADAIKDTSMVTKIPAMGPIWKKQVDAVTGWGNFKLVDFKRLKGQFGVDWVLVRYPGVAGLNCHWHNYLLDVCQIP